MCSRRKAFLPVLLLAGCFVLTLGRGAASAQFRGGHGGHGGGGGGRNRTMGVPFGDFGNLRFATGGHRVDRRRLHSAGFGPLYDAPYYYDDSYAEEDHERGPREPDGKAGGTHSGYCDVSSHSYPQNCVWKDGP